MKFTPIIGVVMAILGIGCLALLIFGGHMLGVYVQELMDLQLAARELLMRNGLIIPIILIYIVLISLPFIPGAEIGFSMLVIFGADFAGVLYLATVAALTLSFSIGRLAPSHSLDRALAWLGFARTAQMLSEQRSKSQPPHASLIDTYQFPRWAHWLFRHKLLALIALINTPGNSLIGGGGGIALAAGVTRLMTFRDFFIGTSLAVAPVPFFVTIAAWFNG